MHRIVLVFGGLAGAIVITSTILGMALVGGEDLASSAWLGYLIMLLALTLIFFGIKRYRDRELGGVIGFGQALLAGLAMSVVAGIVYVAGWELYLAATDHAFMEQYAAAMIARREADGAGGEALSALRAELATMVERYADPLFRLPVTFLEIFPVGLLVSLVSAALLRRSSFLPAQDSR